jgi:hypothetical protein
LGGTDGVPLAEALVVRVDAAVVRVVDGLGLGLVVSVGDTAAPDAVPAAAGWSEPPEPPEKTACTVSRTSTTSAMTEASNNKRRRQ